ncbi:MAG: hypothetical protein RI897_3616 [Verrucomicrobiota bacterium]
MQDLGGVFCGAGGWLTISAFLYGVVVVSATGIWIVCAAQDMGAWRSG